jgi:hypothetical protein
VTNRRVEQYSSYINDYSNPYKGAYTGIVNLPSEESKLYAISNSFGIVFFVTTGTKIYTLGHSVYLSDSSFETYYIAKLYKKDETNLWDSNSSIRVSTNAMTKYLGVSISHPVYNFDNLKLPVITYIRYVIDAVIRWAATQVLRNYSVNDIWKITSSDLYYSNNAISDQYKYFNNYSVRKYASVIKTIHSSTGRIKSYMIGTYSNYEFRVVSITLQYVSNYIIDFSSIPGYPYKDEGRVEHMGWLVLASDNERVIILVKSQDRSYGDTHAKFYYGIWKGLVGQYGDNLVSVSSWSCHYNIPSAITSVIGGDYWVSPDLKWLFYISLNGANYQGFSKGLHTIKGSSALFGENGWTGVSYEMEGGGTDILNACQNYYILDVQFNNKSNKIIVFGNSSKGAFTDPSSTYSYAEGIQPDIILYFIWVENQKKFVRLNSSFIGGDAFWNDYNNSTSGGKGNAYKPLINFVNGEINFMYPGGNEPFNAYRYNLSFGE